MSLSLIHSGYQFVCLSAAPDRSKSHDRFLCEGGGYKFVTECFFITLRALHIGLLVAAETFLKTLRQVDKECAWSQRQSIVL